MDKMESSGTCSGTAGGGFSRRTLPPSPDAKWDGPRSGGRDSCGKDFVCLAMANTAQRAAAAAMKIRYIFSVTCSEL